MKFPHFPMITILAYRPNYLSTQLGHVEDAVDSSFKFYSFNWAERNLIVEKLTEIAYNDIKARRENARHPFHAIVLLSDGKLPTDDMRFDLDAVHQRAREAASAKVTAEEQAKRVDQQARLEEAQRERDFAQLRTLIGRYSKEELRVAGVLPKE